jgi:hypothetical protein
MSGWILVRKDRKGITGQWMASREEAANTVWMALEVDDDLPERVLEEMVHDIEHGEVGSVAFHKDTPEFRIIPAHRTSDGTPITPGLRVKNNDMDTGTIEPEQFMDTGLMSPGGKYFEGWYYVTRDRDGYSGKQFDGDRLKALSETGR